MQFFFNVSGESGYDSKPVICTYLILVQTLCLLVELGLRLCSRLPGKIDNQTEVTRGQSKC
jgi:hypothetical protein